MTDQDASSSSARVQTAVSFFDVVLPRSGYRIAYIMRGEKKFNVFCDTNAELAQLLIDKDDQGCSAYHACASFKVNRHNGNGRTDVGRTQRNVVATRCLWGDADAGEGKPYATASAAATALGTFCRQACVPLAMVIGSGEGLHVYWPFPDDMDPETWRIYAAGLQALCTQYGFHLDRSRTQDLSSVLRTPGTHHRKHGERLVTLQHAAGPFTLEQLEPFRVAGQQAGVRNVAVRRLGTGLGRDLLGGMYDERPVYADRVADGCRQIAILREAPGSIGDTHWHAGAGVFAFCADGRTRPFEWIDSQWHASLANKIDRASQLSGPTTCGHFHSINPSGCLGCPYSGHISTPLEIGRKRVERVRPEEPVHPAEDHQQSSREERPVDPPEGFVYQNGVLSLEHENKNGQPTYTRICKYPIYLKSVQIGEADGSAYSCLFRTHHPRSGWRDIVLSTGVVAGHEAPKEFRKKGVMIENSEGWNKFVNDSYNRFYGKNMVEKRYDKFGWKDDDTAFLVGNRLYTQTGVVPVIGSDTLNTRISHFKFPRTRNASFERWQRAANKMFQKGFEHQSIAILAGFAAPLMHFHNANEGGAILSFISDGSGTGKSTSLEACASIWGEKAGTQLDDSDTRIAKGLKLGMLSHLPVTYDDLYQHDPEVIRQFIMMFTNGTDKDRATTEGTLRENNATWQTILLLTSNKSMIDVISTHDASDASATRIFELATDLPEGTDKDDFDAIRRELGINYGFAGDRYMQSLVQPQTIAWIKENISLWTMQIRKAAELEEHHRFWTRMAVSIVAAGTIVQRLGILDFSVIRIRDWLIETMQNQRDQVKGNRGHTEATSVLGRFIHDMRNDMLTVDKAFRPGGTVIVERPPTGKLLCRYETDTKRLLATEIELRKWLNKRSINSQTFLKNLREQGVLTGISRKHTLGAGTNFASYQVPCYVFDLSQDVARPALKVVQ